MIENLIKLIVVGVILVITYFVISAILALLVVVPQVITILIGLVLALIFIAYAMRLFGITI